MTNLLYSLMLFNERQEGVFIGLFESSEKARQVAEHHLFALPGFRDYPCTYEITEKLVVGIIGQSQKVHMIWGWDEDAEGDETDVWSRSIIGIRKRWARSSLILGTDGKTGRC